jgi:hypothetical protein
MSYPIETIEEGGEAIYPKTCTYGTYGSNKGLEEGLVRELTCANNGKLLGLSGNTNLLMVKRKVKHNNEISLEREKANQLFF